MQAARSFRRILVPTDFLEPAEDALAVAIQVAQRFDATITLQHVFELPTSMYLAAAEGLAASEDYSDEEARAQLRRLADRARAEWRRIEWRFDRGVAWEQILAAAKDEDVDLVVMGTRGRSGCARLLMGSVAEQVLRRSAVPVMTICGRKQDEAQTVTKPVAAAVG